jgi:hypothetical protein
LENHGDTCESTRRPTGVAEHHGKAISKTERLSESEGKNPYSRPNRWDLGGMTSSERSIPTSCERMIRTKPRTEERAVESFQTK